MATTTHYLRRQVRRFGLNEALNATTFPKVVQSTVAMSLSSTFSTNVKAGNVIVAMVGWYSSNTTPTMSDNLGNTYTLVSFSAGVSSTWVGLFMAKVKTGGSCTFTAVAAGSSFSNVCGVEFNGLFGGLVSAAQNSSANSSPTCTINGPGLVVAGIEGYHSGTSFTSNNQTIVIVQGNGSDACAIGIIPDVYGLNRTVTFGGSSLDNWNIAAAIII